MNELALQIDSLHVSYRRVRAVQGLSLKVEKGKVVSLLGPNGAGKSTTLRAISGIVPADSGSIKISGVEILGFRPERIVAMGVAHVPEGREVFTGLTTEENLVLGGTARGGGQRNLEAVYDLFPILADRARQGAGTLSGGQQQMLAIGRALMSEPELLLLDEPSMGLAPIVINELVQKLRDIASTGISILLVEQNAAVALPLADYAYVMATGELQAEGTPDELRSSDILATAYLGG